MNDLPLMGVELTREPYNGDGLPGDWYIFRTPEAVAEVAVFNEPDRFLLHWIQSRRKGHGTILLDAIGHWADFNRLPGKLSCPDDTCPFYARRGWVRVGSWLTPDFAEMERLPR